MIAALAIPRAGEWKHCAATGRDVPVGRCAHSDCGALCYSGWCFFEGTVKVVVLCDDCTATLIGG